MVEILHLISAANQSINKTEKTLNGHEIATAESAMHGRKDWNNYGCLSVHVQHIVSSRNTG